MREQEKQAREGNPILDERTANLLFRGNDIEDILSRIKSQLVSGTVTLDDLMKNPLSDIAAINARLDTIGELVCNPDLRNRLAAVVKTFGIDYEEFYKKLDEYSRLKQAGSYSKGQAAKQLSNFINSIAEAAEQLPLDLGSRRFHSRTLEEISAKYATLFDETHLHNARQFFEYVISLSERMQSLRSKNDEGKKTGFASIFEQDEGISYEQLQGLIDVQELSRFKPWVETAKVIALAASPYLTLAERAFKNKYSCPEIVPREENCLIIKNGKYEYTREPVGNDTYLSPEVRVEVLEGVNNGGKTFDMKKAFSIAIMALSGSWVPAGYAKVSIRDKIILREKGQGDVISALQLDCRNVNEATPRQDEYWLIGLDEIFTSTERKGGEALVYGLIHSTVDQTHSVLKQGLSLLIMSSHYLGLSNYFSGDQRVSFNHFPFRKELGEDGATKVVFPYKKQKGHLQDHAYAIAVASSKGFDQTILEYAKQRLGARKN